MVIIISFLGIIILISLLAILGAFDKNNNTQSKKIASNRISNTTHPTSINNLKPYEKEKLYFYIRGIWAEKERIKAFESLLLSDFVYIEHEPHNPFDKNALAVKTTDNQLIGYIPRNRRKLILTIKRNPDNFAEIHEKKIFYSKKRKHQIYRLGILIWVGFKKEEIETEKTKIKKRYYFEAQKDLLQSRLRTINSNYINFKKTKPEMLTNELLKITSEIIELNKNLIHHTNEKEIKPPLEKLTVMTNYLKKYDETINIMNNFYSEKYYSANQNSKLLSRFEAAKRYREQTN